MTQTRRCLKLLGAGAVISLMVLLTRDMLITGSSRFISHRLVSYLTEHLQYPKLDPTNSSSYSSTAMPPTISTLKAPKKTVYNVTYPKLYGALKPVPGPTNFSAAVDAAAAAAAAVASGPKVCQRPKSQNLVHYLDKNRTSAQQEPTAGTADGGFWAPRNCWPPLSRTAVIVPYRNRSDNLDVFVPYIHRLLSKQNILFGLFVVEQTDWRLFNRAKLLNIGFQLSQRFYQFDCFVFHDSDKVPENAANVYDCINAPKLLISEMRPQGSSKYYRGMLYHNFFGGVSAVSRDAFLKANGNSNRYYGWGREDDELAARLTISGYRIKYSSGPDARYINLQHGNDIVTNTMPWPYGHRVRNTMGSDGLNTLNFTGLKILLHPLFVLLRVEV